MIIGEDLDSFSGILYSKTVLVWLTPSTAKVKWLSLSDPDQRCRGRFFFGRPEVEGIYVQNVQKVQYTQEVQGTAPERNDGPRERAGTLAVSRTLAEKPPGGRLLFWREWAGLASPAPWSRQKGPAGGCRLAKGEEVGRAPPEDRPGGLRRRFTS